MTSEYIEAYHKHIPLPGKVGGSCGTGKGKQQKQSKGKRVAKKGFCKRSAFACLTIQAFKTAQAKETGKERKEHVMAPVTEHQIPWKFRDQCENKQVGAVTPATGSVYETFYKQEREDGERDTAKGSKKKISMAVWGKEHAGRMVGCHACQGEDLQCAAISQCRCRISFHGHKYMCPLFHKMRNGKTIYEKNRGNDQEEKKAARRQPFFDKFNSIIGDNKQLLSVCKDMNIM